MLAKLFEFSENMINELKILYYLFKKENVFRYFLLIFLLMVFSGILFLILEYDRVSAAIPDPDKLSWFERIVTVMYWAIVTVSTAGYGDITPATAAGRIMVIVVLYSSIAAVSLFTANLASALTTKKMMERRGIMNPGTLSNHFVICGWKESMGTILEEIQLSNPKLSLKKIIIIANIEPDTIELFYQQFPEYQSIAILRGEYYHEALLKQAQVQKSQKVLILADETSKMSSTETDSRTIMTAIALKSISMNIAVCAELLDRQFEKFLRSYHVEDIIYTNEYNKILLANSFSQVGLTKFVNNLLDVRLPGFIVTEKIPQDYIGKPYSLLREYYSTNHKTALVGLLENVGSYTERKREAVREAQKTSDVNSLIDNLKTAKTLENNSPNVNPDDSYVIPRNSLAVLVGREKIS